MFPEMERRGNECYRTRMSDAHYSGGCLCGAVRYRAAGTAGNPCYCHCECCRRAAGSPTVPWATFERAHFQLLRGELTEYRSSPDRLRGFCAACGTSLTYRSEKRPTEIDVTLGTLDAPARLAPQMHVWVEDKLPWVTIADGLPQWPRGLGQT
jgi:hypothetical protein